MRSYHEKITMTIFFCKVRPPRPHTPSHPTAATPTAATSATLPDRQVATSSELRTHARFVRVHVVCRQGHHCRV